MLTWIGSKGTKKQMEPGYESWLQALLSPTSVDVAEPIGATKWNGQGIYPSVNMPDCPLANYLTCFVISSSAGIILDFPWYFSMLAVDFPRRK